MRLLSFITLFILSLTMAAQTEGDNKVTFTENIAYRTDKGPNCVLDMAEPVYTEGQPLRPVILFIHGGGWNGGSKKEGLYRTMMLEYAMKGYVVASMEYRFVREAPMPACIEDARCAVRWIKAHAGQLHIDPERIGTYGHSAGGHLSLMLGVAADSKAFESEDAPWKEYSPSVTCAAGGAPPTEIGNPNSEWGQHTEWWPIGYISKQKTPILVFQGDADPLVLPQRTESWVEKMREAGSDVEYIKVEGDHGVAYDKQMNVVRPALEAFFERHLKPSKTNVAGETN